MDQIAFPLADEPSMLPLIASGAALPAPPELPVQTATRRRPKPGERRAQILEALAAMLESPGTERVTTAALAGKLGVSEAALYRHFASKAQMFESLLDFIEQSIFSLINQITAKYADPHTQVRLIVGTLVQFAEKNRGLTRVMVGDALVWENERLQQRMNLLFDKVEATIKQCLREAALVDGAVGPAVPAAVAAGVLVGFLMGRLQRFARSGFRRLPSDQLEATLRYLLVGDWR